MADIEFSEENAATMTLEVECGGRRFSPASDRPVPTRPEQIRRLRERKEETGLSNLLFDAVSSRLAWNKLPREESERQPWVEAYIQSLQQLEGFRRDVEDMVRLACLANLEFRQGKGVTQVSARDEAISAKLDEMLAKAATHWLPTKNILDAKLVAQSVATVREELGNALSEATTDFVTRFLELLARLVDRQVFGLMEWLPNHCCNYHFFKEVVIQENDGTTSHVIGSRRDNRNEFVSGRRIFGWEEVEDRTEGKHLHRFARHEHSVMNAVRTTIKNSRVVIPPEVVPLVEQIPQWLYPLVYMIDGDIIRERIVEQDTKVETWTDVHVHDEPIFGCEPAVIIGPYVLTGWGPREVGVEQARRQAAQDTAIQQQTESLAKTRVPWFVAAATLLTPVALFLLIRSLCGEGGTVLVVLTTMAAIGAVWQATFDFGTTNWKPKAALVAHCWAASFTLTILLVYWLVARWFFPMSWLTPVALAIGIAVVHTAGIRFQQK
jgi:uncharacterized membrane protein